MRELHFAAGGSPAAAAAISAAASGVSGPTAMRTSRSSGRRAVSAPVDFSSASALPHAFLAWSVSLSFATQALDALQFGLDDERVGIGVRGLANEDGIIFLQFQPGAVVGFHLDRCHHRPLRLCVQPREKLAGFLQLGLCPCRLLLGQFMGGSRKRKLQSLAGLALGWH